MGKQADRFHGRIAGVGTSSGTRLVVGRWVRSPLGSFSDVMIESPDGHRTLLAPSPAIAAYISSTYTFDTVIAGPVTITGDRRWQIRAEELDLTLLVGGPTSLGRWLALVPDVLAARPAWNIAIDPLARVIVPGVSTRGSAGTGRTEYYGATGQQRIDSIEARWQGADLGTLTDVDPAVRFGFSSTPPEPTVTSVITTIVERSSAETTGP